MKKLLHKVVFVLALLILIGFTLVATGITILSTLLSFIGPPACAFIGILALAVIVSSSSLD